MTRVLVVEDEPDIALGLEQDLRLDGYQVDVLDNGQRAFERASTGAFDGARPRTRRRSATPYSRKCGITQPAARNLTM